ncbi:pyridoxal phosphate-dependent transferase, partial [Parachaetomium inaequale]
MAEATTNSTSLGVDNTIENGKEQPKKLINLLRGWPAPSLLPASGLQSAANYVLSDPEIAVPVLQYGIDPGYQPLREEVARWLSEMYKYPSAGIGSGSGSEGSSGGGSQGGISTGITADEITITGGASQSLACVLQSFTDPGYTRAVWVVAPCYFMACPIFEDSGFRGRLRAVPEDEAGVDVGVLERRLREYEAEEWKNHPFKNPYPDRKLYRHVIYLVATCANPSGKTMPLARRQQLVHLAREHDALIISDDVYDFLQWPVTPQIPTSPSPSPLPPLLPLLSQIDAALPPSRHNPPGKDFSHAISNASFSKLVGPGIRTGWIHATPDFAYGFSVTGTNRSGGAASQFAAGVVWRMLSIGEL